MYIRLSDCVSTDEENMAASLQGASCAAIVKGLGKTATGIFTCGGTLQTPHTVQLNYRNKFGKWDEAAFPGLKDADFQPMLESSKVASFGRGKETVTDKSYRDAYVLEPDQFLSSFQLSDTGILGEIRMLLVPDVLSIHAELYKMNIYTAPNGCFKAHVDTPRGGNMFGSLVVCLPSQFSGGALVTRHNGQEITYDWSSPGDNPIQKVQWAALYSDVEHEILTVTEGHRVTLTYNLYHSEGPSLELDMTTSPFYNDLKAALNHPHFLRNGGTLGFTCQHSYIFEKLNQSDNLPILLKGFDHTVFLAAKSLNLVVTVKPIYEDDDDDEGKKYVGKEFSYLYVVCNRHGEDMDWEEYFEYRNIIDDSSITWCQKISNWKNGIIAPVSDYEVYIRTCYQAAAILVTIPQWSDRHAVEMEEDCPITSITDEPPLKKTKQTVKV